MEKIIRLKRFHTKKAIIWIFLTVFLAGTLVFLGPASADIKAWPFLEVTDEDTTIMYPFYVSEPDFRMIFPFYYNTNDRRDHHFLWPLVKFSDDELTRFAPFWFREQDRTFTLLPLIRQTPDSTLWFLPPMYFTRDGSFSAVFPFYVKNNNKLFVFPNIYRKTEYNRTTHFNVFPLYQYKIEADGKFQHFAFIAGKKQDRYSATSWFLPLYLKMQTPEKERLWLFPYYHDEVRGESTSMLLPIYRRKQFHDGDSLQLLTYYRHMTEQKNQTAIFPLFSFKDQLLPNGSHRKSDWALWPIYSKKETTSVYGEVLTRKRRFLVFTDELAEDGSRTMSILGIPVREDLG